MEIEHPVQNVLRDDARRYRTPPRDTSQENKCLNKRSYPGAFSRFLTVLRCAHLLYMDCNGILRTYLLAVKLFRPDPSLGKITGEVVMKWARQVFADHGIAETDIAGAVTDAGADVSTGVGKAFPREWCVGRT